MDNQTIYAHTKLNLKKDTVKVFITNPNMKIIYYNFPNKDHDSTLTKEGAPSCMHNEKGGISSYTKIANEWAAVHVQSFQYWSLKLNPRIQGLINPWEKRRHFSPKLNFMTYWNQVHIKCGKNDNKSLEVNLTLLELSYIKCISKI